ncbi:hypothetical protein SNOUR_26305 [Streptomyces noursei ATCC 11455]|nr:hypothetical protein SNOUR_26305 [Streptomyces noursei ATCC 11455]
MTYVTYVTGAGAIDGGAGRRAKAPGPPGPLPRGARVPTRRRTGAQSMSGGTVLPLRIRLWPNSTIFCA